MRYLVASQFIVLASSKLAKMLGGRWLRRSDGNDRRTLVR